jgi:hypothetical protein
MLKFLKNCLSALKSKFIKCEKCENFPENGYFNSFCQKCAHDHFIMYKTSGKNRE